MQVCVCVCERQRERESASLLETVKDWLHLGNDSGGASASGAQSHPVPPKGTYKLRQFLYQITNRKMLCCADKN